MSDDVAVAKVVMPEKGVFLVRCQCEPPPCGAEAIVSLDYGADIGTVVESGTYDPERHGPRPPGFLLLRGREPGDDAQLAENERLSIAMRNTFVKAAQADVPDLRVPYARLSFARTRLFLRFASSVRKPDLSRPIAETRRRFDVSVNVWQMGPRDEVGMMGAVKDGYVRDVEAAAGAAFFRKLSSSSSGGGVSFSSRMSPSQGMDIPSFNFR